MKSTSSTNATTGASPATRWNGWARHGPRTCWRLLVEDAASEDEARELLRRRVANLRSVDVYVAAAGVDPNRGPGR